jgi:hypothetical protein
MFTGTSKTPLRAKKSDATTLVPECNVKLSWDGMWDGKRKRGFCVFIALILPVNKKRGVLSFYKCHKNCKLNWKHLILEILYLYLYLSCCCTLTLPLLSPKPKPVLWIRIRKDPKLLAGSGSGSVTRGYGSGSVTRSYGSGSETGFKSYRY